MSLVSQLQLVVTNPLKETPSGNWGPNLFGFQMEESLQGIGGWEKRKKLEWQLDRGATLAERGCALFVDETKKNGLSDFEALERAI